MAALDLPAQNYMLPFADPDVAQAQAQQRRLAASQAEAQQQQAQLRRTTLENRAATNADLGQTMSADAAQWVQTPGYTGPDGKGVDFAHAPQEAKAHFIDPYSAIANQAPAAWNAAQRAATSNPDIGIPPTPPGSIVNETVGPDGATHRSFQFNAPLAQSESGELKLPDAEEGVAQGIAKTQFDLSALPRDPNKRIRILNRVTQLDPTFDEKTYPAKLGTMKSFSSGPDAANVTALNTAIGHLGDVIKAGNALGSGNYQIINKGRNFLNKQTGDPAIADFETKADALTSEMAKVFKGTGAATNQEITEWRKNLSPDMSPAQLKASTAAMIDLMASRLNALGEKYKTGLGKEPDRPFLSPKSQAILRTNGLSIGGEQTEQVDPRMELAKQALTDPAATPEHKAAAKKIMGLP